jgi:alcohol dehydrogenase class IV
MSFIVNKTRTSFSFLCPTSIEFGVGVAANAPARAKDLGITKAMVVTDKFLAETKDSIALVEGLKAQGCTPFVWAEVTPDPTDILIEKGTDAYLKAGCNGLVALGGGSHIDTAKGIGVLAMNGKNLSDYYSHLPAPAPITKMPPLICIPTTSGTGSDVTNVAVITAGDRKFGLAHALVAPTMSLVDPSLTLTLPPMQTASTGLDALCHALEGYISILENPITDALALYAIELISQNLRRAVYSGTDLEARTNMSVAALLGGIVINTTYATHGHALGQALGGKFHIVHGFSCALILPAGLEYNRPACEEKLARVARVMGVDTEGMTQLEAANAGIASVAQLIEDLGLPTLAEATGIKAADINPVAAAAAADGCNFLNPRPWTTESYAKVLRKTLGFD